MTPNVCPICDRPLTFDTSPNAGACYAMDNSKSSLEQDLALGVHRYIRRDGDRWMRFYRFGSFLRGYWFYHREERTSVGCYTLNTYANGAIVVDPLSIDFDPKNPRSLIEQINILHAFV